MKKSTMIVKSKKDYEIQVLINNTALIAGSGVTGLLNIKNNSVIGEMRNYYTKYNDRKKYYFQTYDANMATQDAKNLVKKTAIRVYDAQSEQMIIDGAEYVEWLGEYKDALSIRYADGTYHLFDENIARTEKSILDTNLDGIKFFFKYYNENYIIVCKNNKWGLYSIGKGLLTSISYDEITKMHNIIVFKEGDKYHFIFDSDPTSFTSAKFDRIIQDKDNENIIYCYTGTMLYIYNTYTKEVIFKTNNEDAKYCKKSGDSYNEYSGNFYFITFNKAKNGLVLCEREQRSKERPNPGINQVRLLNNEYDEVLKADYSEFFYLRKGNKWGILTGSSSNRKLIDPAYDDIDYLGNNIFRLYHDGTSDIASITSYKGLEIKVKNVKSVKAYRDSVVYEKDNNKKGIIYTDSDNRGETLDENFDSVEHFGESYYLVTKNNLQGVIHLAEFIIPMEYEGISYNLHKKDYHDTKSCDMAYFALKKHGEYTLAKRRDYNYRSSNKDCPVEFAGNRTYKEIEFYTDIVVLRDTMHAYIYDYKDKFFKSFSADVEISEIKDDEEYSTKKPYYSIGGVYYFYQDGKFEEVHMEMNDCYVTTYEIEGDTFEIRTFNKIEHDKFCKAIDSLEDSEAHNILNEYDSNPYKRRNNYPTLTLTRVEKPDKK